MKAELEFIENFDQHSFSIKRIVRQSRPVLSKAWHYHPEIEICLTLTSNGKRFIGNNISNYMEDDLVLIGKHIPHGFTTDMYCEQIVVQFRRSAFGRDFFDKPELQGISHLLQRARLGLSFGGESVPYLKKQIIELTNQSNQTNKFLSLLNILNKMANSQDVSQICNEEYALMFRSSRLSNIEKIYTYIMDNFQKKIYVKDLADSINITESAFYKYIKKNTGKTLTEIVNEFRINHATKLLVSTDKSISVICFESGFQNLSHFNRRFKKKMGASPLQYRTSSLVN